MRRLVATPRGDGEAQMAAFNFHRRRTRRWWYVGTTLVVAAFFAVFFVTSSSALINSPSGFEVGDGNMTLGTSGNTDWNCFSGSGGFGSANLGGSFTKTDCAAKTGATDITADSTAAGELEMKGGTKFDTLCPVIQGGNNPPKDEWTNVAQYIEASPTLNSDQGHDIFFYGASIRPVVNGNSSGNIYFSQGTNPAGAGCRTVGDILLTFDFLNGGGSTPVLHLLKWVGSGSCYVGSDSAPCWGPSNPPALSGDNSGGASNGSPIAAADNAISGTDLPVNAFAEIGVNLTQAIKAAGGGTTCFANETWVSRSSGSSFGSQPEDVEQDNQPTCGSITIIKHTNPRGLNQQFSYTGTGAGIASSFHLNDGGHTNTIDDVACTDATGAPRDSTVASPCNTRTFSNLPSANYSVIEGSDPTGFAFSSVSCKKNGTPVASGSGGLTITGRTVSISLGISENWVCTYVNDQQLGAIKILKTSSKAAHTPLNQAHFQICSNDGPYNTGTNHDQNPCSPVQTGSGDLVTTGTGTSAGTVCIENLPFGSNYYVSEKSPPTGYSDDSAGATTHVTVSVNTTCSGSPQTFTYRDTPLTDLSVHVASEATGGTNSRISCVISGTTTNVGNSPQPADTPGSPPVQNFGDPETVTANALSPGTYVCTVVIDP
jgi:prealbumin domain-containing protein